MQNFGEHLRLLRNRKGFSLNKVFEKTGITDSRLSKAENGSWNNLKIDDLKKLAKLYDSPIVPLCLMAELFDENDIEQYRSTFKNVNLLDDEEKKHIQSEIDFIIRRKR
ncbi:helix-turn-helix domain-containing protein [Butyrivibrio sp. M55]|uniref:helix-turn-helix domain-containing protein n=1 Tax=Butyrivibrio sp. M55 TaxID=1855323 RepID=UPI0008E5483D|nr:helix-turn-helix transcriptional regulator [Butyrivibrio sp. M55]SFU95721.1 Helix-turn-helix domain-containing protein [Butyrivibrio sp. M55]